ncbi:MAG: hypothetical protein QM713_04060 [Arachnia sp.]
MPAIEGEDPVSPTPLAPYLHTVTESVTINHARQRIIAECMRPFGFDMAVPPFSQSLRSARQEETQMLSRLFGATDRDLAKQYGYSIKLDEPPESAQTAEPNHSFVLLGVTELADWDPRAGAAATESPGTIDGIEIPPGGCASEAERRLGGVSEHVSSLARDLWIANSQEATTLPEYRDVVNEWTECMAEKGYTLSGPHTSQPGDDDYEIRQRNPLTSPSDEEVTMVLADIDCKEQTDLYSRLQEILQEFDRKSVEKNQLALQEDRARIEETVRLATAEIEKMGGFE